MDFLRESARFNLCETQALGQILNLPKSDNVKYVFNLKCIILTYFK